MKDQNKDNNATGTPPEEKQGEQKLRLLGGDVPNALPPGDQNEPKSEQKPEEKTGKKHGRPHLIPDEVIAKKFGMQRDDDSENDPDDEPKGERKWTQAELIARKKRRKLYIVLVLIIAAAIAVILWLAIPNSGKSSYDNNMSGIVEDPLEVKEGFPATISGTNVNQGNFFTMERDLVYISDTSVVRLDGGAKAVYERSHSFYHPISRASGEYLMVYNVGSSGFRIDNKKETVRNETTEQVVMAADVSASGKYGVVTETKGYPSFLQVFQSDGSLQYKYYFSNCYVTDISLSPDGSQAAVVGITASEGQLVSEVYLLDFNDETPKAVVQLPGTLLMETRYYDGKALAVGDNMTVSVNQKGEMTQYAYETRKLGSYRFADGRLVMALSPYDNDSKSRLVVIDSNANEVCGAELSGIMTSVDLKGDTMAALCGDQVYSYSVNAVRNFRGKDGEQQAAFHITEATNDTKAIALADESAVYLLGISEVRYEDY